MRIWAIKTADRLVRGFGIAHARTTGFGLSRRCRKLPPTLLVALLLPALLAADERAATNEPSPKLKPIDRSELEKAVAAGTAISHRAIKGQDIAAVLLGQTRPNETCGSRSALRIDNSYVDGEILIEQKRAEKVESEDEETTEAPKQGLSVWISIPISIRASVIHGKVTVSRIGLGCILDFQDSKFDEIFSLNHVAVARDTILEDTVFRKEVEVINSSLKGSVIARRAQFLGNAEFIPGGGQQVQFLGGADFQEAVFHRFANFIGTKFERSMNFRYSQFKSDANFSNTSLGWGPAGHPSGLFYMTEFSGRSTFRRAHFKGLRFWRTTFRDDVEFDNIHGAGSPPDGGCFWRSSGFLGCEHREVQLPRMDIR